MTTTEPESMSSGGLAAQPTPRKIVGGALTILGTASASKSEIQIKLVERKLRKSFDDLDSRWYSHWTDEPFDFEQVLWPRWLDTAFVRYFELWNKNGLDWAKFCRALNCPYERLRSHFVGVIGVLNSKSKQAIERRDGTWHAVHLERIYPRIPRLPPEGINAARAVARAQAEKRKPADHNPVNTA